MKNLRILVVDDDPVIRRLLEERLKQANHQVDLAQDGYIARDLLVEKSFDLVITDLMMPGEIGGIEVLELAKEADNSVEVLLITAHSSVDTAVAAMKKGATDYLEKPINFDELFLRLDKIANIQTILENARDLREAMTTTEGEASLTIQDLEIRLARLQETLDQLLLVLQSNQDADELIITKAIKLIEALEQ